MERRSPRPIQPRSILQEKRATRTTFKRMDLAPSGAMKHELPPLPFAENALEPNISAETIRYHYGKHHKAYVDKLNDLIQGTQFENSSLEDIIRNAPEGPIFNNAAQTWNHNFLWRCLTPEISEPKGELLTAIARDFGSVSK